MSAGELLFPGGGARDQMFSCPDRLLEKKILPSLENTGEKFIVLESVTQTFPRPSEFMTQTSIRA